ncbi:MAG: hypothetical protein M0T77_12340, partial [Actinomycetota bacterium]|nr:hypothetical protein [Actinomycetota bacterium]
MSVTAAERSELGCGLREWQQRALGALEAWRAGSFLIAARLHAISGAPPVVVLHQDRRSAARLAAFRGSRDPWIVAVNMVSEGVGIPRLRVGVYATRSLAVSRRRAGSTSRLSRAFATMPRVSRPNCGSGCAGRVWTARLPMASMMGPRIVPQNLEE